MSTIWLTRNLAVQSLLEQAEALALSRRNRPILLRGESGTGRRTLARFIHDNSDRVERPFVELNCAALTAANWELELSGDDRNAGKLTAARGGTLFLAEVGRAPLPAQRRFMELLGEPDPWVIASTGDDLETLMAEGRFLSGLLEKLGELTLAVPPLRERREDLQMLTELLLAQLTASRARIELTSDAVGAILLHRWPGNLRELRQALAWALTRTDGRGPIDLAHLPGPVQAAIEPPPPKELFRRYMRAAELLIIRWALALCGDDRTRAARFLGLSRAAFYKKLRLYPEFR